MAELDRAIIVQEVSDKRQPVILQTWTTGWTETQISCVLEAADVLGFDVACASEDKHDALITITGSDPQWSEYFSLVTRMMSGEYVRAK